jgi:hypothetical protein
VGPCPQLLQGELLDPSTCVSAALEQRLSLISSRACREIAHGICSFPSVISKSTRLPSQRARDGDVIQLKNAIAGPPSYTWCGIIIIYVVLGEDGREFIQIQVLGQESIELIRQRSQERFSRRTALRDEAEPSRLDPVHHHARRIASRSADPRVRDQAEPRGA